MDALLVKDSATINKIKAIDSIVFPNCGNEFKPNRKWFAIVVRGEVIAYAGAIYTDGICIFNRAWVSHKHRGKGYQLRLINKRIEYAKKRKCTSVITYTTHDNSYSINNLIKSGFMAYHPQFEWVGGKMIYWKLQLHEK